MISQWHYILNLQFMFGMTECKRVVTPPWSKSETRCQLRHYRVWAAHYLQLLGILIYLSITWPDLSYAVGLLSHLMQAPHLIYLDCVKWVLRYVSGTMDYDILYKSTMLIGLKGYTDATSPATNLTDTRLQGSSCLSKVELSHGAARSGQSSHYQAQRANTGASSWLYLKLYGLKEIWKNFSSPSMTQYWSTTIILSTFI